MTNLEWPCMYILNYCIREEHVCTLASLSFFWRETKLGVATLTRSQIIILLVQA